MSNPILAAALAGRTAFLFDLDGTLIDSSPCHERAYLDALRSLRPDLAADFRYERYKGWRTRDAVVDMGVRDPAMAEALTEAKQASYRGQVEAGDVALMPGARALLEHLRDRGRRVFLVTGGSRRSTESVLDRLGIREVFEGVVTGDDVVNSKPDPEGFLKCVRDGGIRPEEALVVEDALSGIQSARSAGLAAIAVNNEELASLPEWAGTIADVLDFSSR